MFQALLGVDSWFFPAVHNELIPGLFTSVVQIHPSPSQQTFPRAPIPLFSTMYRKQNTK